MESGGGKPVPVLSDVVSSLFVCSSREWCVWPIFRGPVGEQLMEGKCVRSKDSGCCDFSVSVHTAVCQEVSGKETQN